MQGRRSVHVVLAVAFGALAFSGCVATETDDPSVPFVGLVAASHPEATAAGLEILRAGGNAVDAAAAVQFALNVVEPMMSGIGGGAFLLVWDAERQTLMALDGREVAPAAATPDMFQGAALTGDVDPRERGIAVGVPGTLKVWHEALARQGTMSLDEVLAPAVSLASDGFMVDEVTNEYIEATIDKIRRWPTAAALLLDGADCPPQEASQVAAGDELVIVPCVGGTARAPGDRIMQPRLAEAFSLIAREGPDVFYAGPLGEAVVAAQASRGGRMTMDDLGAYVVAEREVLVRPWRGYEVATLPLPSGGPVLQETLAILEPLDVSQRTKPEAAHNVIEAMHLAFADRAAYMGDPEAALATHDELLDPGFIASRRALIDPGRTGAPYPAGHVAAAAPSEARGLVAPGLHTTHFTVMDAAGNMVAATTTIESVFGSGILVPEYGFFLNNEMTDFDLEPGGPNEVGPGKRPLSSMTPTVVLRDGSPVLGLGSPGGSTIPGSVLQVLLDVLVDGTPVQEAVDAPRWAARRTAELLHEQALDAALRDALASRGHELHEVGRVGGVQAIHLDTDHGWTAAADPRRAGAVGSL